MDVMNLGGGGGETLGPVAYAKQAMETYTQRVARSIADAEQRLADLKRMQEIFAKHPEFEELLTLVQRGRI